MKFVAEIDAAVLAYPQKHGGRGRERERERAGVWHIDEKVIRQNWYVHSV